MGERLVSLQSRRQTADGLSNLASQIKIFILRKEKFGPLRFARIKVDLNKIAIIPQVQTITKKTLAKRIAAAR